jgi:molybdate transport system substrate-binding protein
MKTFSLAAALYAAAMLGAGAPACAEEIRVLSTNGMKSVIEQLAPQFEKATGHRIVSTWGAAIPLKADIENGATFDLAILTVETLDDLVREGKLAGTTRTILANSYAGIAVRRGASRPDVGTVAAFKQALLDARSIAYVERGSTGVYFKSLLQKFGIAEAVKDKLKPLPPENPAAEAVSNGEAEIGLTQISEILPYPGAELAGPLPAEIQLTTRFAAAVGAGTRQAESANALIRFITAPSAAPVYKAKGLDPAQ